MSIQAIGSLGNALMQSPMGQIGGRVTNKLLDLLGLRKGGRVKKVKRKAIVVGLSQHDRVPVHLHRNEVVLTPAQNKKYEKVMRKTKRKYKK